MSRKNFLPDGVLFQKEKAGFVEKVSLNIIVYGNEGNILKYNMEDDTMNGNARAYSYLTGKGVVNMKNHLTKNRKHRRKRQNCLQNRVNGFMWDFWKPKCGVSIAANIPVWQRPPE